MLSTQTNTAKRRQIEIDKAGVRENEKEKHKQRKRVRCVSYFKSLSTVNKYNVGLKQKSWEKIRFNLIE